MWLCAPGRSSTRAVKAAVRWPQKPAPRFLGDLRLPGPSPLRHVPTPPGRVVRRRSLSSPRRNPVAVVLVEHDTTEQRRGFGTRREVDRHGGGRPGPPPRALPISIDDCRKILPVPRSDAVVGLQEEFVVPVDGGHHGGVQEFAEFAGQGLVQFCRPAAPLVDIAEVAL